MATDEQALLLQVSADVSKLQKQFEKAVAAVNDNSGKMERRAKSLEKSLGQAFEAPNLDKSLTAIFNRTRFAAIEEGSAKIGLFGSALEPLGGYGLAAAAAIAAVGVAFEEARNAAEDADSLDDTAHKLHVTTDALQEYRYAVFAAGGTTEGADQALEQFSITLGKAQEGLKKGQRPFAALGFTKAEINSFTDIDSALKAVVTRINELKNNPQRDALISQLGLDGMKPLILDGVEALDRLRAKAHEIGIVMDADLVRRGAAANKEFEVLEQVISVQLKSAFVDLAPVLADVLRGAAAIAKEIAGVVDMLHAIENRSTQHLRDERDQLMRQIQGFGYNPEPAQRTIIRENMDKIVRIDDELRNRSTAEAAPGVPSGTRALIPQGGGSGSKYDIVKASQDAIAQALEGELAARKALVASVQEEFELEKASINAAADKKVADLERQAADKKITAAASREAIRLTNEERDEKVALATRQATWKLEDQEWAVHKALLEAQIAELQAQEEMATTQAERNRIEREINRLKHQEAWQEQGRDLSRQVETGQMTQGQADAILGAGDAGRRAETQSLIYKQWYDPVHSAIDAAVRGGWPGLAQYMADRFKTKLIDALSDSIVQSLLGGGGGGGGFGNLVSSFFSFLPGFASGTPFAPGGLAIVGEDGPEIVNLPRGAKVTPNNGLRQALASTAAPQRAGGFAPYFDLRGAVMTQDLLDQMNALANQSAHGVVQAYAPALIAGAAAKARSDSARRAALLIR